MNQPAPIIPIVEVIGPAAQGKSIPFLCGGSDGHRYYVKGQQTNRASLWREWIAAHLGQALGLPLPPFSLVQLDEALVNELDPAWREIGCGPAFGSRQHPSAAWFEPSMVNQVPVATQQAVLAFDWWVHNMDRLTGNTNLLWDADGKSLVVIDHNMAFDPDFSAHDFCQDHVFSAQWQALCSDLVTQDEHVQRFMAALPQAQLACDNAPLEWHWANPEMDIPANFRVEEALATLSRCATPELWRTV
mgnify:CR=1 FL=1